MTNWKNFERRVAAKVGGKRIPITGRKCLDIDHPTLDIECKYRKNLPVWLFKDAWSQANTGSGIPVIAVGVRGYPYGILYPRPRWLGGWGWLGLFRRRRRRRRCRRRGGGVYGLGLGVYYPV